MFSYYHGRLAQSQHDAAFAHQLPSPPLRATTSWYGDNHHTQSPHFQSPEPTNAYFSNPESHNPTRLNQPHHLPPESKALRIRFALSHGLWRHPFADVPNFAFRLTRDNPPVMSSKIRRTGWACTTCADAPPKAEARRRRDSFVGRWTIDPGSVVGSGEFAHRDEYDRDVPHDPSAEKNESPVLQDNPVLNPNTHTQHTVSIPAVRSIWGMNHNVIPQDPVPHTHPQPLHVGNPIELPGGRRWRRTYRRMRDRLAAEQRQREVDWAMGIWD
ncbi:hypothetical protein FB567DRAFT_524779 [Paraphoma chrysanthemicola]|uniref:Uncharacterized protein n=1 Tax=Paraphoma chrysanthemicola TaxID=798071 RepID=A0A8K0VYK4_9PLEO|nr:hypothetical protein FB567DRAFT_524779 [Paraphoma chrysanthemicola]